MFRRQPRSRMLPGVYAARAADVTFESAREVALIRIANRQRDVAERQIGGVAPRRAFLS
jgi:hypothetical protein